MFDLYIISKNLCLFNNTTKRTNIIFRKNVEFLNVTESGTYIYHTALRS